MLGKINEKTAATAIGNSNHGNISHLVLLICDTINRHCKINIVYMNTMNMREVKKLLS